VDPGKDGAVAVLTDRGDVVGVHHTPRLGGRTREYDVARMARVLEQYADELVRVAVERQSKRPDESRAATFSTGRGQGLWEGVVAGLGVPCELPLPTQWHRAVVTGTSPKDGPKRRACIAASRLFPTTDLTKPSGLSYDQGVIDALLIAEWCRRRG